MTLYISCAQAFSMLMGLFLCLYTAVMIAHCFAKGKFSIQKEINRLILILYLAFVFAVSFFPVQYTPVSNEPLFIASNINAFPFSQLIYKISTAFSDLNSPIEGIMRLCGYIFGNLLILFPVGFLLPRVIKKTRKPAVFFAFIIFISISIEALQFAESSYGLVNGKGANTDEAVLMTIGAGIGFILIKKLLRKYCDPAENAD